MLVEVRELLGEDPLERLGERLGGGRIGGEPEPPEEPVDGPPIVFSMTSSRERK